MGYQYALDALGDPTRRTIFEMLRDEELAVGEIAARLPVSRPGVSKHLRVLRLARLVSERRAGTRHLFRVDPNGVAEVRAYFDSIWTDALDRYRELAEGADPDVREEQT
jgi:DNA-binding transcriptional ArsR family regulator